MSVKCFYNIHCTLDHEPRYLRDVKVEMLVEAFKEWLSNHKEEDSWSVYSHEILFSNDGCPFNDDSGEVYDDI